MNKYCVQHECYQNRGGTLETFPEHSLIFARDMEEAKKIAARIPLDARRRKLTQVIAIG